MRHSSIFMNGGTVTHRVTLPGSNCRFSVWTTDKGVLAGAARYDSLHRELNATPEQTERLNRMAPALHATAHAKG